MRNGFQSVNINFLYVPISDFPHPLVTQKPRCSQLNGSFM